jgi:succinyl-CoA synthetase beta subunit
MDIKGHTVEAVMVAEGADIAEEFYFSMLLDRAQRTYLALCSVEGGMEIEQLAEERPEALVRRTLDPRTGLDAAAAAAIVAEAGFPQTSPRRSLRVLVLLGGVYAAEDATWSR